MRRRYEVRAPVEDYTGEAAGVTFTQGVGHTCEPAALAYFHRHGYTITEADDPGGAVPPSPPAKSASKAEWKTYAVTQGMAEADADALTRDQLVDHFTGA